MRVSLLGCLPGQLEHKFKVATWSGHKRNFQTRFGDFNNDQSDSEF